MNLYMVCEAVNPAAYRELPAGYRVRNLRRDERELWYAFPFDTAAEQAENRAMMVRFYERAFTPREDLFYESCKVLVDDRDTPVATGFVWPAVHGRITTLHWIKVLRTHENLGLGRALLTLLMRSIAPEDYPVYLHSQPESFRAIKLYSDFGFRLLDTETVGQRSNDLARALPLLREWMTPEAYARLEITGPPPGFLDHVRGEPCDDF